MQFAFDLITGHLVDAGTIDRRPGFACPHCLVQVFLRSGRHRTPHFAHQPGEGSLLCEEYHPGSSRQGQADASLTETGASLCLSVHENDDEWELFIDFDEISAAESAGTLLSLLSSDSIEIRGPGPMRALPAADLWPGTGRNIVRIGPSRRGTSVHPVGRWPSNIRQRRWEVAFAGIGAEGALFVRFRGGSYRRVRGTAPVCWGERVVLVSTSDAPLPVQQAHRLRPLSNTEGTWYAWAVDLPGREDPTLARWLRSFGAIAVPRVSRTQLINVPTTYSAGGVPAFAPGDPIIVAAHSRAEVLVAESDGDVHATAVDGIDRVRHFAVWTDAPGPMRFRTKTQGDILSIDVVAEVDSPPDGLASPWSVVYGDTVIAPFTTHRSPRSDLDARVQSCIPTLRFTLSAHSSSSPSTTVHRADSATATQFLRDHAHRAREIEIDAGNLGFVRLAFGADQARDPISDKRSRRMRPTWATAHAIAADQSGDSSTPHWRIAFEPRVRGHRPRHP